MFICIMHGSVNYSTKSYPKFLCEHGSYKKQTPKWCVQETEENVSEEEESRWRQRELNTTMLM